MYLHNHFFSHFHIQVDCPFIVCMTYAFHTPDKLCFILDLMNGGDLHYHLSQHGVFNEADMKFYAAEVNIRYIELIDKMEMQLCIFKNLMHCRRYG